jgi:prepilin peptidase CpaA
MPAAAEMLRWSIVLLLSILLVIVSVSDIRDRRIPNWTVLAIAVLFVPWIFLDARVSIVSSLEAALIAFVASCALYAFRVVGAGDSKLLTVTALFAGMTKLPHFLVLVALTGGVIALASLLARPVRAAVMFHMRGKGDFGRGVPYGVAIAIATMVIIVWPFPQNFLN